ncbi:hypothetical protein P3X46_024952 [Hevea brasiliensis]|uniref:EF-hand domain-containing protein n=1 Tax=Hevea brasiliensis TaxID=3981 RepID=A0ABQ9L422_HEVBR|nr:hypothetical protein P3X46_024952 [Hevea brasiliensis]
MEEIREAALAYYAKFTDEQKQSAIIAFEAIDKSQNGKISLHEYAEFFKKSNIAEIPGLLSGLYFSCTQCFYGSGETFELCSTCYRNKDMDHHKDAVFLDNYALLRNKKQNMEKAMLGIKAALDAVTSSSNLLDLTSTVVDAASSCIIM